MINFPADFDGALAEFFEFLYLDRDGRCRYLAEAALANLGSGLPLSKFDLRSHNLPLRGWRRLVPPVSHPPITWDLAFYSRCCR